MGSGEVMAIGKEVSGDGRRFLARGKETSITMVKIQNKIKMNRGPHFVCYLCM